MLLKDKTVIITGASAGIGRAAALLFADEGANLVLGARRGELLAGLVDEIAAKKSGRAVALAGDVCNETYAKDLADLAVKKFGGLDVGFHTAGSLGAMGETAGVSSDAWRDTIDVNLNSAFYAAKHQAPLLVERGGGSLIFTSSFVGHTAGMPGLAAYASAKAGLIGLTKALAVEFGPKAVRVNALLPGGTDTDMGRIFANTPEMREYVCSIHALQRMAHPDEIAGAALFLASDMSGFVTGTAMLADGGVSVYRN